MEIKIIFCGFFCESKDAKRGECVSHLFIFQEASTISDFHDEGKHG